MPQLPSTLLYACYESSKIGLLSFGPLVDSLVGRLENPDSAPAFLALPHGAPFGAVHLEHLGHYAPISVLQTSSYIPLVLLF